MGAALALGLLLRWWFVWRYSSISDDALLYGNIAQTLLKHHVYGIASVVNGVQVIRPTLIRLPGYPFFLALCFAIFGVGNYTAVIWLQVLADLWTCLLLAATTHRIAGERCGRAALWLAVACPFTATYCAAPLTEVLTLWTIALVLYGTVRWRQAEGGLNPWLGLIAFSLAFSIVLRPDQGLLAAAIVPGLLWLERIALKEAAPTQRLSAQHSRLFRLVLPSLAVSLLTLLPLVPWTARNWRTFHVVQPLAPKNANDPGTSVPYGFERWYRTWAVDYESTEEVYWKYDSDTIAIGDLPDRAFDSRAQYADTEALLNRYNQATTATPELDREFANIAQQRIAENLLRYYLVLPIGRVLDMMLRPRADLLPWPIDWWRFSQHPQDSTGMSAFALLNLAYFVLAAIGFKRRRTLASVWVPLVWTMAAFLLLRTALLLTLDNSEPRYTLEFYPVLIVLGACVFSGRRNSQNAPERSAAM